FMGASFAPLLNFSIHTFLHYKYCRGEETSPLSYVISSILTIFIDIAEGKGQQARVKPLV
ncbi:MAG: hypothetical protein ACLBM6_07525, partial [Cuspidothrix sp.]